MSSRPDPFRPCLCTRLGHLAVDTGDQPEKLGTDLECRGAIQALRPWQQRKLGLVRRPDRCAGLDSGIAYQGRSSITPSCRINMLRIGFQGHLYSA